MGDPMWHTPPASVARLHMGRDLETVTLLVQALELRCPGCRVDPDSTEGGMEGRCEGEAEIAALLSQCRGCQESAEAGRDTVGWSLCLHKSMVLLLLDIRLLDSRTAREYISVVLSQLVCGGLLQQSQEVRPRTLFSPCPLAPFSSAA